MADTRELTNAADDVATAYAQYLLRGAVASTHALHLYEQVIGCVGRRQISPDTLQNSLIGFIATRGSASQTNVVAAARRFVDSLASLGVIDDTYFADLAAVATGDKQARDVRRAHAKQLNTSLASTLSRASAAWFELLGALDEERASFATTYLLDVLRRANPIGFHGDVIELSGPINTKVTTTLTLDNTLAERAVIRCVVGDVRRADGIGPAFIPDLVFAPEAVIVEGADDAELRLSLWLEDAVYTPHSSYVGSLHITRDDAPRLDIPLRITPTPPASPTSSTS
jgi:hypothetical protein